MNFNSNYYNWMGGESDQSRRLYEEGVNESWTKVDHGKEGVIRA